ncbi:hypothetical protein Aperf_G00000125305 [Anoplocephala perfoliata]
MSLSTAVSISPATDKCWSFHSSGFDIECHLKAWNVCLSSGHILTYRERNGEGKSVIQQCNNWRSTGNLDQLDDDRKNFGGGGGSTLSDDYDACASSMRLWQGDIKKNIIDAFVVNMLLERSVGFVVRLTVHDIAAYTSSGAKNCSWSLLAN